MTRWNNSRGDHNNRGQEHPVILPGLVPPSGTARLAQNAAAHRKSGSILGDISIMSTASKV